MLILSRRKDEAILVGDDIRVVVIQTGSTVRIGIEAPKGVTILREELAEETRSNGSAAVAGASERH